MKLFLNNLIFILFYFTRLQQYTHFLNLNPATTYINKILYTRRTDASNKIIFWDFLGNVKVNETVFLEVGTASITSCNI